MAGERSAIYQRCEEWLTRSRVGRELQSIVFSIIGGSGRSLWQAILVDLILTVAIFVLLGSFVQYLGVPIECLRACLISESQVQCCSTNWLWVAPIVAILLCGLSCLFSRRRGRADRTQHSAILSVLVMLPIAIWLAFGPLPWLIVFVVPIFGIVVMFIGYKLSYLL